MATESFLEGLPGGRAAYLEALGQMYCRLYMLGMPEGTTLFLDKTPRYYHIIPELRQVFPAARLILLFRNPLAVLASIITTWLRGDWFVLQYYAQDLIAAPRLLVDGRASIRDGAVVVRYEDLVHDPSAALQDICHHLGIEYEAQMIHYGAAEEPGWPFGDMGMISQKKWPVNASMEKWIRLCEEDVQVWRLMDDYLRALGPELIAGMGYDFEALRDILAVRRPKTAALKATCSFAWLLSRPKSERRPWERAVLHLSGSMQRRRTWVADARAPFKAEQSQQTGTA